MCYINGTELTIAGNGSGKIFANADSMNMFNGFSAVTEINGNNLIDTSNVTRMHSMFSGCEALTSLDLSGFDTSKVKTVGHMFSSCKALATVDISSFSVSSLQIATGMFYACKNLKTIYASDTSAMTNVENGDNIFIDCFGLVGGNGTAWNVNCVGKDYVRVDTTGATGYFTKKR